MFNSIKEILSGKKTYVLGIIAIITAAATWGTGGITSVQAVTAIIAALQSMFIRAGIAKK